MKGFLPEVMQGSMWRDKQLQTQLASWAELRHDNVLYAKQSYTGVFMCEYPEGYVEPYPELYQKLGEMATAMVEPLLALEMQNEHPNKEEYDKLEKQQMIRFLTRFAKIMGQLEEISIQELAGEPMSDAQRMFIESTIDRRGSLPYGSGTRPHYDGWYCDLFYGKNDPSLWDPIIADVHTNPMDHEALHVGVGDVNFAVLAVDSENDVAAYVGPVYSFYEFTRPAEKRMTDAQWQHQISTGDLPPRPDWTKSFVASPTKRDYGGLSVRSERDFWVVSDSLRAIRSLGLPAGAHGQSTAIGERRGYMAVGPIDSSLAIEATDPGLEKLLSLVEEHGSPVRFGIALGSVTSKGLKSLVDVKSLAWIDATGSKIAEEDIENFRKLRPDVDVLRRTVGIEKLVVCRRIDGLGEFEEDTSGMLKPGEPLLLYVEAKNLAWNSKRFDVGMNLKINVLLVNTSNKAVSCQLVEPAELQMLQSEEIKYAAVELQVPESLERGSYKIHLELQDEAARPSCTASKKIVVEY